MVSYRPGTAHIIIISHRRIQGQSVAPLGECRAQTYNRGLGESPSGVQGQNPDQGLREASPPEAESFLAFTQPEKLDHLSYNLF